MILQTRCRPPHKPVPLYLWMEHAESMKTDRVNCSVRDVKWSGIHAT